MKGVLSIILLTNLIYRLHEFLRIHLLHFRQWIMQAPYMFATYVKVVELTEHGYF